MIEQEDVVIVVQVFFRDCGKVEALDVPCRGLAPLRKIAFSVWLSLVSECIPETSRLALVWLAKQDWMGVVLSRHLVVEVEGEVREMPG